MGAPKQYLYACAGGFVQVNEITDPTGPVLRYSVAMPGFSQAVGLVSAGNYLFVTTGADIALFLVIDITDPLAASIVATLDLSASFYGLGRIAMAGPAIVCVPCIANDASPFQNPFLLTINVANPLLPFVAGSCNATAVLSDPNNPYLYWGGGFGNVTVLGTVGIVAAAYLVGYSVYGWYISSEIGALPILYDKGYSVFSVVDITDPTNPTVISVSGGGFPLDEFSTLQIIPNPPWALGNWYYNIGPPTEVFNCTGPGLTILISTSNGQPGVEPPPPLLKVGSVTLLPPPPWDPDGTSGSYAGPQNAVGLFGGHLLATGFYDAGEYPDQVDHYALWTDGQVFDGGSPPPLGGGSPLYQILVNGQYAYISGYGITVIDLNNPTVAAGWGGSALGQMALKQFGSGDIFPEYIKRRGAPGNS